MRSGNDAKRGIYRKFIVQRADGSHRPGEKHSGCKYFVLDLQHDQFAAAAVRAYAAACREAFPALSDDLVAIANGDRTPLRKMREPRSRFPSAGPDYDR